MTRLLALVILISTAFSLSAAADGASGLARAMDQMRKGDWDAALGSAGRRGSVERDLIEWHRLRAGRGTAQDVIAFLNRRPDWPGLAYLRRKSEPAIASADPAVTLAYYRKSPPQTAEGVLDHANALLKTGYKGDAEAALVLAWRTMPMGRQIQESYLKAHAKLLAPHHAARLDRMLWDGHKDSAGRMLPLVKDGQRALAEARIALQDRTPGVDAKIEAVPETLKSAAGLAYDRFVWRDRKGRDADAIELLLERSTSAESLGEPDKWARRRTNIARSLMRAGDPVRAYHIAAGHHLSDGSAYAELEWLAGFLALRKLNDATTALRHFQRFDAAVASPISKGRAGYWLGRAHDALNDATSARTAYAEGAKYQTSFYGLLAAERAGLPFDPLLVTPPAVPAWRDADFMTSSVAQAALLLLSADEPALAERFLTHLVESQDAIAAAQLGEMALELDRPHLAVMIAKRAARQAVVLHSAYYPIHPVAKMELPMAPEMTLAIARRESEFDPVVVSGAGARGLMQVMPRTARSVAEEMGILGGHNTDRLTSEWRYNAQLGANYLAKLAGELNGNVVMMAAGYNAGPGRPLQWAEKFGDPRRAKSAGEIDMVDWIEHIPFNETRNYVMRVTESLPVYRARLGQDPLPIPFSAELTGSTLRAFAP
ncbi:lytic transglycosylase domain-containing protein [Arenibacterium sp. CAU 1754]